MGITSRPFRDLADLRAIQAAITAAWLTHRPLVGVTAGDVAWWYVSGPPDTDWTQRIRLWERDDGLVAWGWFAGPATLDLFVCPGIAVAERRRTVAELAGWLEDRATWWDATGPHDPPTSPATDLTAYALDHDLAMAADLAAAGFEPAATPEMSMNHRHLPTAMVEPEPVIPPGYVLRHVDGERELEARVDVHRAAFAPSRMTVEKYRRLVALDDYAFERDLVIAAPDGTFAAFTLVWWDPVARVGEFEPVGVHPDHRRLGLGRAVNLAGLRLLRELGAVDAIVFSAIANAASEALYRSDGFERISTFRAWRRPRIERARGDGSRGGTAVG
jgi:ribosomal protein S18 acetylase RimI-like enzyme